MAEEVYNGVYDGDDAVAASSRYADQQDAEDLIGQANLAIGGDLDNDSTLDSGIVQRDLDWSAGYIDLELARASLTVPVDTDAADAHVTEALRDISAHLTVWYLWHHRGLEERGLRADDDRLAGIMSGYKAYADEQLAKLVTVLQKADDDDDAEEAGTFGFVPIRRAATCAADENSS